MSKVTLPRGPSIHRLFQTIKMIHHPIRFLEKCRNSYGSTFFIRLLGSPGTVVISNPIDLKQVFSGNSPQLHTGEINATFMRPITGENSMLSLDGKKHFHHRKLILPAFNRQKINGYAEVMEKIAWDKIMSWRQGEVITILDEMRNITFSIILKTVLGLNKTDVKSERLAKCLHQLSDFMLKPFTQFILLIPALHRNLGVLTPWAKLAKLRRQVDICLFEEIESRRKEDLNVRNDVLSLLLQGHDEEGNPISNQEIRDEILTLLVAGHETTTNGATWAVYNILSAPTVFNKLKKELSDVACKERGLIASIDELIYMDAVIKEALRIMPVFSSVLRLTKEEYKLGGYNLPKGLRILPCIYLAHRDSSVWSEPHKFIPERFLDSSEAPYSYLPFGNGIRRCIGATFAHYEMKIILAKILLHVELELKDKARPRLKKLALINSPLSGIPVYVKKIFV